MILQIKHSGQLCNRLFSLLPTISYAIHNKKRVYVLFERKEYLDYFPNILHNPYVKFLLSKDNDGRQSLERLMMCFTKSSKKNLGNKFERAMVRLANNPKYVVNGDLAEIDDKRGICCIDGWEHRNDISYIEEERAAVLDMFMPDESYVANVEKEFDSYDGLTVGVHVRRGDYKTYFGGKWYFDDETYWDAIQQIHIQLMNLGEAKHRFLVCSNEPFAIKDEMVEMFQIKPLSPSDCMTDLYALSRCDYIIGPPSTFSQWSSYYGHVPLRVMRYKGERILLSEFSSFVLLDRNEKGFDDYLYETFHKPTR